MRELTKKLLTALCAVLVLLAGGGSIVPLAAETAASVVDPDRTCTLSISYQDAEDGSLPVAGAQFTAYRIAGIAADGGAQVDEVLAGVFPDASAEGLQRSLQKKNTAQLVAQLLAEAGSDRRVVLETGKDGTAETKLPQGIWLVEESRAAKDHFPSEPFLVSLPWTSGGSSWNYATVAEPKSLPAGTLVIRKRVQGAGASTDQVFTFGVVISDVLYGDGGSYPYTTSDGRSGRITSGGDITLSAGQSAKISMIPAGSTYQVREKEADTDGYTTTSSGAQGTVPRLGEVSAVFTNRKTKLEGQTPKPPTSSTSSTASTIPSKPSTATSGKVSVPVTRTTTSSSTGSVGEPSAAAKRVLAAVTPKTGDLSRPLLWGGCAAGAALILIVLLRKRRSGEKKQ